MRNPPAKRISDLRDSSADAENPGAVFPARFPEYSVPPRETRDFRPNGGTYYETNSSAARQGFATATATAMAAA
jgi:hypothetical protein